MVLLGGRAAEELIFGKNKISTGAQGDIGQTTDMAMAMVIKSIVMIPDNFKRPIKAAANTGAQIPEPHSASDIIALDRVY